MVKRGVKKGARKVLPKRKYGSQHLDSDEDGTADTSESNNPRKKVRWGESFEISEEEEEGTSEDATSEKTCLATSSQFGRVGCAYYDPVTNKIYVLEDSQESQHFDLTTMFLDQADPDIVLTTSKADDNFIDVLRNYVDASGGVFQIRPHKDFIASKGRDRVLALRLLSELPADNLDAQGLSDLGSMEPNNAYEFMTRRREINGDPTLQKWNASIRLANYASVDGAPLCLGSLGALLDHLARVRAVGELDDEGIGGLEIRGIEYIALKQVMQINADALYSLQVFDNENHASIHSDKMKEGLSLFGILNNTKTALGRALMREWLLRPSLSISVINARHDAVACFMRPDNTTTADVMHGHLKGIKNVPRIIAVMKGGKAKVSDWQGIVKFAFHSVMLRDAVPELSHAGGVDIVKRLVEALDIASFRDVGTSVNETIDWEESANAGRVCVRPHISEELDDLKHIYHGIDDVLSKVAEQISTTVPPDYAASLNVVYFPQLGFLICVPLLEEWKTEIEVLEGWSYQFSSDSHVYFKSQEMHDMDKHIGDIHSAIVDREIEIVQTLQDKVLEHADSMGHVCDICAELDCLLSFAEASRAYDYRRPQMSEDNIIDITQGRHPLQELVVDTFVPNDALIVGGDYNTAGETSELDDDLGERNSIVICTGANACGKSVYLKQVAVIQFMAQIGCFVPAERATIGIVDKIFTRVQTRESVSKVQSAFMIDLNQVSLALRNSTARSLILLDEFGKGTVTADGAGLFCGILKHFTNRIQTGTCPKVLAATHFHDIFQEGMLDPSSVPATFVHMQVMIASSAGEVLAVSAAENDVDEAVGGASSEEGQRRVKPGERITYLYRLARGLWLDSHAALCAEIFGIPQRVVQRARYVSHLLSTHELGQLLDEEMSEKERRELESAEEVCRRFLKWDLAGASRDGRGPGEEDAKTMLAKVLGREPVDGE